jgi:hypothetical protein
MTDQSVEAERIARNQLLFRSINEKIEGVNETFGWAAQTYAVLCECADTRCIEQVELTGAEYAAVRDQPGQFIVTVGHVYPEHERVVRTEQRYQVVEKTGLAGEIARGN